MKQKLNSWRELVRPAWRPLDYYLHRVTLIAQLNRLLALLFLNLMGLLCLGVEELVGTG